MKKILHSLSESIKQIFRNKGMAFASFFSITAILIILGIFFVIIANINNIAEIAKQDFGTIRLDLKEGVKKKEATSLALYLKENTTGVQEAYYKSKKEALEEMKEKWGSSGKLLDGITNPLPNSIIVKVSSLEDADEFVKEAAKLKNIENISYHQDTVQKILSVTNLIKIIALILIAALIIISVFVVSNTIKLTVIARKDEIMIMKNVGATNWMIRGPFIFEGIIIGLVAAGVSIGIIAFAYQRLVEKASLSLTLALGTSFVSEEFIISNLAIIFISLGVCVGAIGSIISIRRFLVKVG